jgi:hypothetical protein
MNITTMRKTLLLLPVLLTASSCTTVDIREGAAPGVRVPEVGIRYNFVGIIDKSLQDWNGPVFDPPWSSMFAGGRKERDKHTKIAVESTESRRTATGTLEVWTVLRNRTDHPLQIEGRTQFFDSAKAPAEKPSAWQRVMLPPQSVATYREFSTKVQDVAFYYIEIREGR